MRSRLLTFVAAIVLATALAGCGGGGKITIGKAGAPPTTAADGTTEDSPDGSGTDETLGTVPGSVDDVIPDIGDVPGISDACLEASTAFSAMTAGLAGGDLTTEQQDAIEAARDNLPDDIRDDFDTFSEAFAKLKDEGLIAAGEALSTPEVQAAQQNISDYITEVCGAAGAGG